MERVRVLPGFILLIGAILLLIVCGLVTLGIANRPETTPAVYVPTTDPMVAQMQEVVSQQSTMIAQLVSEKDSVTVQSTVEPTNVMIQPTVPPSEVVVVQPTAIMNIAQDAVSTTVMSSNQQVVECNLVEPDRTNFENWQKTTVELVPGNTWFHRVFNQRLFHAPDWGGADSWFVSLNVGPNNGGAWTSFGNPGQVIYRAEQTSVSWCLGIVTDSEWREQFMQGSIDPLAVNVRVLPNTNVYVRNADGEIISQATSDGGDITIILPDDGVVTIWTAFQTASPTFESHVWWGPYDRSEDINTLDARMQS